LRSKAIMAVSALMPGTANAVVLGRRGALAPKITALGVAVVMPTSSRSRSAVIRPAAVKFATAVAAPKPEIAAAFSVPARWPRSCPPPLISGSPHRDGPRPPTSAPLTAAPPPHKSACPLRPAKLVRGNANEVSTKLRNVAVNPTRSLHSIDMQYARGRVHDFRDLGDGLNDAGFVVGEHDRYHRPCGPSDRLFERGQVEDAIAGDWQFVNGAGRKGPPASHRGGFDCRYK